MMKGLFFGVAVIGLVLVLSSVFLSVGTFATNEAEPVHADKVPPVLGHPYCPQSTEPTTACTSTNRGSWQCTASINVGECVWRCNCVDRNGNGVYENNECGWNLGSPQYCALGCRNVPGGSPPQCA